MTSPALNVATPPPVLTYGHGQSSSTPYRSRTSESVRLWGLWIAGMGIACVDLMAVALLGWVMEDYIGADPLYFFFGWRTWWWYGMGPSPTLAGVLADGIRHTWPLIPAASLLFGYGVTLRMLVRGVADARRGACIGAFCLIVPWTLPLAALVFVPAITALYYGTNVIVPAVSGYFLLLLVFSVLGGWLLTLCIRTLFRLVAVARSPGAGVVAGEDMVLPADGVGALGEDGAAGATGMPRARVLGYLAHIHTPTRVRRVAAMGVRIVGVLATIGAALAFVVVVVSFLRFASAWAGGPLDVNTLVAAMIQAASTNPVAMFAMVCCLPGVTLLFFGGAIRRGRAVPCVLSVLYLAMLIVVTLGATTLANGIAVTASRYIQVELHSRYLFWLLINPPAVVAILLLKDLAACLLWIARSPVTEKVPVRFLPGRKVEPVAAKKEGA